MLKKTLIIITMIVSLSLFLVGCDKYQKDYIQPSNINYPSEDIKTTPFDKFYLTIANDYYQVNNYNNINLYRYKDSAIIEVDFTENATYEDVYAASHFCNDLFVKERGNLFVVAGSISGFQKKVYEENYKFWDSIYFTLKINGKVIYQAFYKLDTNEKLLLENEYIDLEISNLFTLKKNQIKRFTNLAKLEEIGECSYYRNAFDNRLYIDIYNDKFLNYKTFNKMTDILHNAFTNLDKELMFYYNGSYPKIIIRFKDKNGIYYENILVSNVSDGFN